MYREVHENKLPSKYTMKLLRPSVLYYVCVFSYFSFNKELGILFLCLNDVESM
jgi:hypothetical protein